MWSPKTEQPGLGLPENLPFALKIPNDDSGFWEKCSFGLELFLSKKLPINKVESSLKSNHEINQT